MYAAGARDSFDVLGVHAQPFKADPCADPAVVAQSPELTNNDPSPPELKRIYAFRHVEDIRELMVQQGDGAKQMAVLEMGCDDRHAARLAVRVVRREPRGRRRRSWSTRSSARARTGCPGWV